MSSAESARQYASKTKGPTLRVDGDMLIVLYCGRITQLKRASEPGEYMLMQWAVTGEH